MTSSILKYSLIALAIFITLPMQATTADEIYKYCERLPDRTKIKIPRFMCWFADHGLKSVKIVTSENLCASTRDEVFDMINDLHDSETLLEVKARDTNNEDYTHITITPSGKKDVILFIICISEEDLAVVYVKCSIKSIAKYINKYCPEININKTLMI